MINSETWWRELADLDEHQQKVIALPSSGNYLVKGPPGSGKTNLLLLRANYLTTAEHSNLAVVVFNRTLREFIRAGSSRYEFDESRVLTIRQLFDSLLSEAGVTYDNDGTFEEIRDARLNATAELIGNSRQPIYDLILIDEAQDYLAGEIEVFQRLSRDLFMVADSRQQIYPGENSLDTLVAAADITLELPYHYRNGPPICEVADGIGATFSAGYDPILPNCNYNSPEMVPTVEIFQGDLGSQASEIAERLVVQLRAYPQALLGVICPRLSDLRETVAVLESQGLSDQMCVQDREDGYHRIEDDKPIWVSTVHSAKGLEFRALHFAAAEHVKKFGPEQKRLAYTAITRAKTSLVVYHNGDLPGYLDSALNIARPQQPSDVDLGVAFGRS